MTVSASPGSGAVEGDYRLSRNTTLTIAAGTRSSTGVVTLTVMDNQVDTANKIVTVSATVANSQGAVAPVDALLTVTDDDVRGVTVTKTTLDIDGGTDFGADRRGDDHAVLRQPGGDAVGCAGLHQRQLE